MLPLTKAKLRDIIFEADTPTGKHFDLLLLYAIAASVTIVMLESVQSIADKHGALLHAAEWIFTIIFTIEYALRLYCSSQPKKYALSFFGIIDLLSIIPTYLTLVIVGSHYFVTIRIFRILRMFRVLKMVRHVGEANMLMRSILASRAKMTVFIFCVLCVMVIIGTLMYLIEGPKNGFTSIPQSVYWAIVTITTVGFGDITPNTVLGKLLASIAMLMGYAIIAVPTGIVTLELQREMNQEAQSERVCPACASGGHIPSAKHCRDCGSPMNAPSSP